jgi:hypothetical protein
LIKNILPCLGVFGRFIGLAAFFAKFDAVGGVEEEIVEVIFADFQHI